jgi:hypothetical protein
VRLLLSGAVSPHWLQSQSKLLAYGSVRNDASFGAEVKAVSQHEHSSLHPTQHTQTYIHLLAFVDAQLAFDKLPTQTQGICAPECAALHPRTWD